MYEEVQICENLGLRKGIEKANQVIIDVSVVGVDVFLGMWW